MSISPRATAGVLLVLLAGFPILAALPNDAGAVRVAGLSLLWWYGGLVAPVAAVVTLAFGSGQPATGTASTRDGAGAPTSDARATDVS